MLHRTSVKDFCCIATKRVFDERAEARRPPPERLDRNFKVQTPFGETRLRSKNFLLNFFQVRVEPVAFVVRADDQPVAR
jgi:hypothetical protein